MEETETSGLLPINLGFILAAVIPGMKKESILTEEEKMQKWQKIKENRAKKQTNKKDRSQGQLIHKQELVLKGCSIGKQLSHAPKLC